MVVAIVDEIRTDDNPLPHHHSMGLLGTALPLYEVTESETCYSCFDEGAEILGYYGRLSRCVLNRTRPESCSKTVKTFHLGAIAGIHIFVGE